MHVTFATINEKRIDKSKHRFSVFVSFDTIEINANTHRKVNVPIWVGIGGKQS